MILHKTRWKTSGAQKLLATSCNRIPTVARYALDVITGNIATGRLVFLAVERFLDDLAAGHKRGLSFDQGGAVSIIKFFRDLAFAKKPLLPYEQFIVANIFGWKKADGLRRFQDVYVEMGKGNRKTPLAAGIGIYGITADDEPSAEVYVVAPTKEQAAICFKDAVTIVDDQPALRKVVKKFGCSNKYTSGNLSHGSSFMRPIAAERDTLDGPRPHIVIVDEEHEHKDAQVVQKLVAGFKQRKQPLCFKITNSGFDRESICWQDHDYARKVLEKIYENDALFAYVCQLDTCEECRAKGKEQPNCDNCDNWLDEDVWIKTNPALGEILTKQYLQKQVKEALEKPTQQSLVQRLNFCRWTQSRTRAISADQWKQCAGANASDPVAWREGLLESLKGKSCYGALDLASTTDIAASVYFFSKQIGLTKPVVIPFFFIPQSAAQQHVLKNRVPIDMWVKQGFIIETEGEVIDYAVIRSHTKECGENYIVKEIAFDPWNAQQLVTQLENDGFTMVKFPQTIDKFAAPTKEFLKMITGVEFEHGNNPVLAWMADNLVVRSDDSGNQRPVKPNSPNSPNKIDGIVAAIMACGRMAANPESEDSGKVFFA